MSKDGYFARLDDALHTKNAFTSILQVLEDRLHVRRIYIFIGFVVAVGFYLLVGYGAQFLCNFIGFVYPAYNSIKAIESRQKDDDTKWLTYWVIYSGFMLVETVTDIFFFWIPFYSLLKCAFLVYCFAPLPCNGSVFLYHRVVRPCVLGYQDQVDETMTKVADAAKDAVKGMEEFAADAAGDYIKRRLADGTKTD